MVRIGNGWDEILADEFRGENYLKIREFLKDEYSHHVCYPSMYDIFNALKYTDYYDVNIKYARLKEIETLGKNWS